MQPRFSVVIPLHNKGPHIERALQSVASQTVAPAEVIVVDDASTDDGPDLVRGGGSPDIVLLNRDTPGPGGYAARNLGSLKARSDWVAFLDADDEWRPDHLAELGRVIEAAPPNVGMAFCGIENRYSDARREQDAYSAETRTQDHTLLDTERFLQAWLRIGRSPVYTSAVAIRRSLLTGDAAFPDGKGLRGGDIDTWLRAAWAAPSVSSPKVTVVYHRDAVNMVTKRTGTNVPPILAETTRRLGQAAAPAIRRDLDRLSNLEVLNYARQAVREGVRLSPALMGAYRPAGDVRELVTLRLLALAAPLVPLLKRLRSSASGMR